jgi:hypothetical protein
MRKFLRLTALELDPTVVQAVSSRIYLGDVP